MEQTLSSYQMLLGYCINYPQHIDELRSKGITAEDFLQDADKKLYTTLLEMKGEGQTIDITTAPIEYKKVGGKVSYCTELANKCYYDSAFDTHLNEVCNRIIQQKAVKYVYQLKELRDSCQYDEMTDKLMEYSADVGKMASRLRGKFINEPSEGVQKMLDGWGQRVELIKKGEAIGVETGVTALNDMTGGWKPGQLIVLAARPGMGKTSIASHMAVKAAQSGASVLFVTLEMLENQIREKMFCSLLDENCEKVFREMDVQSMNDDFRQKTYSCAKQFANLEIRISDDPVQSVTDIAGTVERLVKEHLCDIAFIDYLGLIDANSSTNGKYTIREQQVAEMSRKLKTTALKLNIPIVLLCQLNRAVESRTDNRPRLSDLRESGSIEQDADIVIFVWSKSGKHDGSGILSVAKHRNGACDDIDFAYNDPMTKLIC